MSKRDQYAPDYSKLYPGVAISPAVMRALDQSDRKMQYYELDLKAERRRENKRTKEIIVSPAREDSLERLAEESGREYALEEASPEEMVMEQDEIARLHNALSKLTEDDRKLIRQVFYEQVSETNLATQLGVTQQTVSYRVKSVCRKLKKILIS